MKKVLAFFIALGLIMSSGSMLSVSAAGADTPTDWDEIPWEVLPLPAP